MHELNDIELAQVTGGCGNCELNPPTAQDLYNPGTQGLDLTGGFFIDIESMMAY